MPKIKINGKETEVAAGKSVLQACLDNGVFVPHYCWHPGLSPAGNCRMCLVKVSNSRKLEVSCMYPCTEGLEVTTEGPEIADARKDVLEFLLINHPLDCPICDKAGECDLQDFTYAYRQGTSRFVEPKNMRHTKDLGPNIRIWGNRCIACSRCVRFCNEISGTGELALVNRGDRSVVDVFPGVPIDNPLSLNVVDICPVGALIDKNFLYSARVWFAQETETVCASCSRGCSSLLTTLDGVIKRHIARENPDTNKYWMCDEGRLNVRYVSSDKRLKVARGTAGELGAAAQTIVRKHGSGSVAGLVSSYQTIEEIFLFKKLMMALKADSVGVLTQSRGERRTFPGGFVIEADKTPNRAFAEMALGPEAVAQGAGRVVADILAGKVRGLMLLNGIPDFAFPTDLLTAAEKLDFLGVMDIAQSPLSDKAHVLLPGAAWAEKDGTFLNVDRRVQRIRRALPPPGAARPEVELLQRALIELRARERLVSAEGVFREVTKEFAGFSDFDYTDVGVKGVALTS
ncbi:MAG: (2Fe-2S)-binding protein [Planctomycetes bacterium]|nr:(2Fe-2S)-binding protein [Planctomycetota bacterium]